MRKVLWIQLMIISETMEKEGKILVVGLCYSAAG
jgi:hypothetical protein